MSVIKRKESSAKCIKIIRFLRKKATSFFEILITKKPPVIAYRRAMLTIEIEILV